MMAYMATKLTIVIDNPNDPGALRGPLQVPGRQGIAGQDPRRPAGRIVQGLPVADGSPTPAYRTIDIYFSDYATT